MNELISFFLKQFSYLTALVWFSAAPAIAGPNFSLVELNPKPNYANKPFANAIPLLSDGALAPHPMWTSAAGVGWGWTPSVVLRLNNNLTAKNQILKLHSACRAQADAKLPKRIDIYTGSKTQLIHSGELTVSDPCNDEMRWLNLNMVNNGPEMYIVIHANGPYIFVDEISLEANAAATPPSNAQTPIPVTTGSNINTLLTQDSQTRQTNALTKILEITPAPNYDKRSYPNAAELLTDNVIAAHPMWLEINKTVGWSWVTPVALRLNNPSSSKNQVLKLHSACRTKASANLPHRIDVYSGSKAQWIHSGELQIPAGCEDEMRWLNVNFSNLGPELYVIMHSNGGFLFSDELKIEISTEESTADRAELKIADASKVVDTLNNDGIARLKTAMNTPIVPKEIANAPAGVSIAQEDPWLSFASGNKKVLAQSVNLQAKGLDFETESLAVAVANNSSTVFQSTIKNSCPAGAVSLFEVMPVKANNGVLAYDPLVPLANNTLTVKPNTLSYLWLKVKLSKLAIGTTNCLLFLNGLSINLAADVVQSNNPPNDLKVAVWGYDTDKPIWSNPEQAMQALREVPVNVQVIPPHEMPDINNAAEMQAGNPQSTLFENTVNRFKPGSTLLLFTAWQKGQVTVEGLRSKGADYQKLTAWLTGIERILNKAGVSNAQWALYPFDEPDKIEDMELIIAVAKAAKTYNPKINIYANPIGYEVSKAAKLKELHDTVDFWQPDFRTASSPSNKFALSSSKNWWIYHNTESPTKAMIPLSDYRLIAWRALALGASGIGTWSFSDTSNSSAWDDFDGKSGADWAMVYEGSGGSIVSSRRWEAFKKGVDDYRLIKLSKAALPTLASVTGLRETQEVDSVRLQALNLLRKP